MQLLPALKHAVASLIPQSWRVHPAQMSMHDAILYGFTGWAKESSAGVYVNETLALNCAAVYACIKVLSEDTSSLPLLLYRRLSSSKGKERAISHPLFPLLHLRPNPWMSSMQYREVVMHHLLSWGNHYSQVRRQYDMPVGPITDLIPLRPDRMEVTTDGNDGLIYKYHKDGGPPRIFDSNNILHIAGLGFDGVIGYSPISKAKETIGLSIAVDEFGSRFFSNGANSSVVLTHPQSLSKQAKERLRDSFDTAYKGVGNAHKTIVLEEGMAIEKLTIPPDDAQFLLTRRYQKEEIASIYRVPLHMIQDLERSTFSNIEHQSLGYVVHSLRPWLVRIEQAISNQLLSDTERDEYFAEHLIDGLLRGDIKSRYDAYAVGRQWGWLSVNDIREMENKNPVEDGDIYLQPLNMVPAGTEFSPLPKNSEPVDPDADDDRSAPTLTPEAPIVRSDTDYLVPFNRLPTTFYPILLDSIQRSVNEEVGAIRKQIKHTFPNAERAAAPGFEEWLTTYYLTYRARLGERVTGPFMTYLEQIRDLSLLALGGDITLPSGIDVFPQAYIDAFTMRYTAFARNQLVDIIRNSQYPGDIAEAITTRLDEWLMSPTRAEKVARDEATRMLNAMMRETWKSRGVMKLKWVNIGLENCPFCRSLNGKIVGIDQYFLGDGEVMYVSDEGDVSIHRDNRPDSCHCDESTGECTCGGTEHREKWQALKSFGPKFHPPIHRGCDCRIVPVIS